MSEMIERVARALFDDEWPGEPLEEEWDHNRDAWRQKARAAIEAMREPTKAMLGDQGQPDPRFDDLDYRLEPSEYPRALTKIWEAMIDAALKDAP
jgi:hypothetical protein